MNNSLCTKMTQMNEKILKSVTEKLNENFNRSLELATQIFQSMIMQVTKSLTNCFQNALAILMQRLDILMQRLDVELG